jgi:hypothetical protein
MDCDIPVLGSNGHRTDDLTHEMAHFVEIDEERMNQDGWGLYVGEWHDGYDKYGGFYVYNGVKDIERECRVVALQANLHEQLGIPFDVVDFGRALRFVPGFHNLIGEPYYVKSAVDDRYKHKWVRERIAAHRQDPHFSSESFIAEWWRRNNLLKSRLAA